MLSDKPHDAELTSLLDRLVRSGMAIKHGEGPGIFGIRWNPDFLDGRGGEQAFLLFAAILAKLLDGPFLSPLEQGLVVILSALTPPEGDPDPQK